MDRFNETSLAVRHVGRFMVACGAAAVIAGCGADRPTSPTPASCTFTVAFPDASFGASGGTGNASVTTAAGCAWRAASDADWIAVDGVNHTGSGNLSFTVAASAQSDTRSGRLTVAGQALSVRQDGAQGPGPAACDFSIAANPDDFERDGGNGTVTISTRAGCAWTLHQDAGWLTVEGPTEGAGPAALKVNAAFNEDVAARRLTLTVADKSVVITQPGQGDCTYGFSRDNDEAPGIQWRGAVDLQTSRGCRWTAASTAPWLHALEASGHGSARVTYEADANPGTARSGMLAFRWVAPTAGQNVRVLQFGFCATLLIPSTRTVGGDGGRFSVDVLVDPVFSCVWAVEPPSDAWITVQSPAPGTTARGDGGIVFVIAPNPSSQSRETVLRVGERPLTVIQEGR